MLRKNTRTVLVVFAVLLALLLIWQRVPQLSGTGEETATSPPLSPPLLGVGLEEIVGLTVTSAEGQTASYQMTDSGEWEQLEPDFVPGELVDLFTLNQVINQMVGWRELTSIDPITELDAVGLASPAYRISLTLQDGESLRVDVGSQTVTGSGYYIRVEGQLPQIVRLFSVDPVLDLLTNPPLLPTPFPTSDPDATPEATEP